jgi:branched-subunit amino acid transport protein
MNRPWLLLASIAGCGLLTFLLRLSFIAGGRRFTLGPRFQGMLRYIPPAVLTAIIVPEILVRHGALDLRPSNPRLWAGVVAILVAAWSRSVLATIAAGMAVLWTVQYFL